MRCKLCNERLLTPKEQNDKICFFCWMTRTADKIEEEDIKEVYIGTGHLEAPRR